MIPKVIPGAEPIFIKGNSIGFLLAHGFNGTPQSMEGLSRKFAEAGFTVYAPRMKGHGTSPADLEACTSSDWLRSLEEGFTLLKKACDKVFIVGQSMGSALTIQLASRSDADGIILINTALEVPGYEKYKNESSPRFIQEGRPDIKNPDVKEIAYSEVPLTAVHELFSLMKTTRPVIKDVTCPVLLFHSAEDHVVPQSCSDYIYETVSSSLKEYIHLNHSYHVASMDYDQQLIYDETVLFATRALANDGIILQA
ncbi:alpha/beta fold hydrolase [Metabacillus sp. GX 13764]|uniref:alpha/beta hydrolase n=1 Tax=Metabacillus kandeliae TaxID=2900151 RepID=UPI001E447524|nr:alpha/beta fold hydrolase [Metabacillus kandeliae]MCD7035907.1 alpha/beta fold hydrolase [Metabacillus kandeliae]